MDDDARNALAASLDVHPDLLHWVDDVPLAAPALGQYHRVTRPEAPCAAVGVAEGGEGQKGQFLFLPNTWPHRGWFEGMGAGLAHRERRLRNQNRAHERSDCSKVRCLRSVRSFI